MSIKKSSSEWKQNSIAIIDKINLSNNEFKILYFR